MTPHVGTSTPTALVEIRWDHPDLGEWDVRALVGHTSRAFLAIEPLLVEAGSSCRGVYRHRLLPCRASPRWWRGDRRAGRGGAALGADPASAVVDIAERVPAIVGSADPEVLLTTAVGGMRLADHRPTRTFELVVHTSDLAAALGAPLDIPATAAAQALKIVAGLAIADGLTGPLHLASNGRSDLPIGFNALGCEPQ